MTVPIQPTGIDVSHHQGAVDWVAVAKAGMAFAFIKATEGTTYTDPGFGRNWDDSQAAGLLRGAYHFFHPEVDPVKQAEFFTHTMGHLFPGDIQPVVDIEVGPGWMAPTDIVNSLWKFIMATQERTGRNVIIYTYPDYWIRRTRDSKEFALANPLWAANYDVAHPWHGQWPNYSFWQFTSHGRCPGVHGDCDLNRFNGTMDNLRKFAGY